MEYKWLERNPVNKIRKSDELKEKILKIRGVNDLIMDDFFTPDEFYENDLHLIRNIEKATNKIVDAIQNGKKITISGDPDVDGVTSLAIMTQRLKELTENVDYIYGERSFGHGITTQFTKTNTMTEENKELIEDNIKKLKETDLLIIVDSSSNDVDGVKYVKTLNENIDICIFDHHNFNSTEIEDEMDNLATVINIQHSKDKSPNKCLSGAGVVYKVCKALDEAYDVPNNSNKYLDLVAVGLVGDMMSMMEMENRYYIQMGLSTLHNIGLQRILKGAKVNTYKYSTKDIGFSVAPLINSSARMGQLKLAIEILLAPNDTVAKKLRLQMDKLNKKRRELQVDLTNKYRDMVDENQKIIILTDNESISGFNGLISQSLAKEFQRPTFILTEIGDTLFGSGRSFGGLNTNEFLSQLDYVDASGHDEAHGLELPKEKLSEFNKFIEDNLSDDYKSDNIKYFDVTLTVDEFLSNLLDLEYMNKITGTDFPEIIVKLENLPIEERNVIGKTKETIKFKSQDDIVFIKFKVDEEWRNDIEQGDNVDVIGVPAQNVFYNFATRETTKTPQIQILEIIKK